MTKKWWVLMFGSAWCVVYLAQIAAIEIGIRSVDGLPFSVRSSMEIARHTAWTRTAALSLLCSEGGNLHFKLTTRLPAARQFVRDNEREDDVSLFVDGYEKNLQFATTIVKRGRDIRWYERLLLSEALGEPDTVVTPPLDPIDVAKISRWFEPVPPSRVSVVGIHETGTYMKGTGSASDIRDFLSACLSESGKPGVVGKPELVRRLAFQSGGLGGPVAYSRLSCPHHPFAPTLCKYTSCCG